MKYLKKILLSFVLFVIPSVFAAAREQSFKGISEPIFAMTKLMKVICLVAGAGLLTSAMIKYKQYRDDPAGVSLFSCIASLLAGIALIILGVIPLPKFF